MAVFMTCIVLSSYFERLNQLYRDYALNIQKIHKSYNESIRFIERMNELDKEYVENYSKTNQLYKQHFEDMHRMNQQWLNASWRPFGREQRQQQQRQETKR
jgi:hypothetical protein